MSGGSPDGAIRAFLALEIPAAIKEDLARQVAALKPRLEPARWVRSEGLHLTLKFLGESEPDRLERLADLLRPLLKGGGPVEVRLAGSGFFPGPRRPRVAWVGGTAAGAAEAASAIDTAARRLGWERERRPFALHLTLARLRSPWRGESVERWLEWGRGYAAAPFVCREVVLFRSRLEPGGAVYTPLERLPLGDGR
ncbi:MAG TPA: RNA 2',3'-cyclic phosphodiesterase [Acidobacteria bacterium]|nr:RNA 2',3'-cyclic phosphodiesterase [Acidobacteriota bacterium]